MERYLAIKVVKYKQDSFEINYEILNSDCNKTMIFLHGWGSNKEVMKSAFCKTFKEYKHIYIDMPGFGKSTNSTILTTDDYKNILDIFLDSIKTKKEIIFGHSFGGKVATLLSPKVLVLLSSAGIVQKKSIFVRVKISSFKLLKYLGLGRFYRLFASKDVNKMSKNMYETFKNVVDEDFANNFRNFKNMVYIFWGKDDMATSLSSAKIINKLLEHSKLYVLDGDHYFFLKQAKTVEKLLKENIK